MCSGQVGALPPRPEGPVADLAGILDPSTVSELDGLIRQTREKNGAVLVIATVPSLEDMTVEDYAVKLFKSWGIGDKDKNNGILLLVAPTEHKVRIEVGYGLEGILPDGRCGDIIRADIVPAFKRGAPAEGVLAGARAIEAVLGGEPASEQPPAPAGEDLALTLKALAGTVVMAIAIFIIGLAFGYTERGHGWAFIFCLLALVPALYGIYLAVNIIGGVLWVIGLAALTIGEHLGSGRLVTPGRRGRGGWTSGGFGGFTGGFSSGGGGGGSFGGFGGGFSGGGGASGSW